MPRTRVGVVMRVDKEMNRILITNTWYTLDEESRCWLEKVQPGSIVKFVATGTTIKRMLKPEWEPNDT